MKRTEEFIVRLHVQERIHHKVVVLGLLAQPIIVTLHESLARRAVNTSVFLVNELPRTPSRSRHRSIDNLLGRASRLRSGFSKCTVLCRCSPDDRNDCRNCRDDRNEANFELSGQKEFRRCLGPVENSRNTTDDEARSCSGDALEHYSQSSEIRSRNCLTPCSLLECLYESISFLRDRIAS